jgi:uncharacterized protein YndB with AHSA1/START domain
MVQPRTRTIQLRVFIRKPPKVVFNAVSQPKSLPLWFVDRASISRRKGGTYAYSWEDGPTHSGKVLEFVRNRHLTLAWQWPGSEGLGVTRLRMSVERRENGTVLTFTHRGFRTGKAWDELYDGAIHGWSYFMLNLKSVLEHGYDLRSPYDW